MLLGVDVPDDESSLLSRLGVASRDEIGGEDSDSVESDVARRGDDKLFGFTGGRGATRFRPDELRDEPSEDDLGEEGDLGE